MKQAQYIFLSLAALTGLAACSSDSDLTPSSRSEGNAVVVKASVGKGSIFTRTNPAGTTEEQKVFNPGDEIALTDGTKTVNYTLAADGTTWNPSTPGEYLVWGNGTMNFKAYYPVGNYCDGSDNYTNSFDKGGVQTNQADIAKSDYMTATATETKPGNHTLNLKFERQTARIVVKIKGYNNQFPGLNPRIKYCNIYGAIDDSQSVEGIYSHAVEDNSEYMALVYPGKAKPNEYFLSITVVHNDDGYGETETEVFLKGIPALEAGNSYTFSLIVGKDKLTIEDVTVEDWTQGAAIPGGEATTEKIKKEISEATKNDLGKVVTSDGFIYSTKADADAAGAKPVAMIAYVGDDTGDNTYNHGLAIGLSNAVFIQSTINNAKTALKRYDAEIPEGYSWKYPSINNLKHIFASFDGTPYDATMPTYEQPWSMGDLLNQKLEACGGRTLINDYIYTTDTNGEDCWVYDSKDKKWVYVAKSEFANCRPIFAF